MSLNTNPLFVGTPKMGGVGITFTSANTAKDGTGTVQTLWTAPTEGSYLMRIICKPLGTNVATVLRLFVNNGGASSTATNNSMIKEIPLPAITLTETAAQSDFEFIWNLPVQSAYKINGVIATAVAAGWHVTIVGGDFTIVP